MVPLFFKRRDNDARQRRRQILTASLSLRSCRKTRPHPIQTLSFSARGQRDGVVARRNDADARSFWFPIQTYTNQSFDSDIDARRCRCRLVFKPTLIHFQWFTHGAITAHNRQPFHSPLPEPLLYYYIL